jgi:BirA family biotin operon repressor/biotin-[acetyl-CoA-carboxylase] ligase
MIKREMILAQNPWLTDVSVVAETTSTQIDAKNDLVDKKLFIADMQTQTRGRFGRQYFASNGDGIYMSLVLKISEDVKDYTINSSCRPYSNRKFNDKKTTRQMGQRYLFR